MQKRTLLLGDEAVAWGAIHAGITAAYGYPGTPSTEIMEALLSYSEENGNQPHANWCVNEKTALEAALGTSVMGCRAIVTMKHVGLNVAADPFMSASLLSIRGGLVIAVADDPGMHSSQNEQDTRFLADFARVICVEPSDHQEAYEMTRAAFELSEKHHMPVVLRLVTRLSHGRGIVEMTKPQTPHTLSKSHNANEWILMPANARKQWKKRLTDHKTLVADSEASPFNTSYTLANPEGLAVITTGMAKPYYEEVIAQLTASKLGPMRPSWFHIGQYPVPEGRLRSFLKEQKTVLVIEEGYPFVEKMLRGIELEATSSKASLEVLGKMNSATGVLPVLPADGELNPDLIKQALAQALHLGPVRTPDKHKLQSLTTLPERPPQLCPGCPHADSFGFVKAALADFTHGKPHLVTSDIGCYTLGAMPEYGAIETCVCMGASIAMAKGAADAGLRPVVAMIGDGTFFHSGIPPLLDAIAANTPMTVIIMDNQTVGMTGGQNIISSSKLQNVVLGLGASAEHVHVVEAHRRQHTANTELMKKELDYAGLSVIIAVRECIETAKRKKRTDALAETATDKGGAV